MIMNKEVKIVDTEIGYKVLDLDGVILYDSSEEAALELCDDDQLNVINTISVFAAKTLLKLLRGEIEWIYGNGVFVTHLSKRDKDDMWNDEKFNATSVAVNFRKYDLIDSVPNDNEHSDLYYERYNAYRHELYSYVKNKFNGRTDFNGPKQYIETETRIMIPVIYNSYRYRVIVTRLGMYHAYSDRTWWGFGSCIKLRREKIKEEA